MNPHAAYRQLAVTASTRIDLLLALYDGAIERVTAALNCLRAGDSNGAVTHIARAQLIVSGLSSGVVPQQAPELCANILRLYEYVAHRLTQANIAALSSALEVLGNLRDGFQAIRTEAINLERAGHIPPVTADSTVSSLA